MILKNIYAKLYRNIQNYRIKNLYYNKLFSEMDASLAANTYNCRRNSNTVVAANLSTYVETTLAKAWNALSFLNDYTDGGFFKLRQVVDKADIKRASAYRMISGQKVESGWMSQIKGIVADSPNKIRGDRCDVLLYEELGSWDKSTKAFIQGDALVGIQGMTFGIKIGGGIQFAALKLKKNGGD